jgi:hypothetical protein
MRERPEARRSGQLWRPLPSHEPDPQQIAKWSWLRYYLAAVQDGANNESAASEAGVHHNTPYYWRGRSLSVCAAVMDARSDRRMSQMARRAEDVFRICSRYGLPYTLGHSLNLNLAPE